MGSEAPNKPSSIISGSVIILFFGVWPEDGCSYICSAPLVGLRFAHRTADFSHIHGAAEFHLFVYKKARKYSRN